MRKVVASAFTVLFLANVAPAVAQTTHRVTSLSSDVTTGYPAWAKRESTCNQTSTGDLLGPPGPADVTTGEVRLGPYTDGLQFSAVLSTFPAADFTLADIERLGYEERAVGGMDGYNAPYLRIFTTTDGTDFHSVIFSPSTQSGGPGSSLNWRRHEITAGTVRYDDDPGNAPDITWAELIALHGSDRVTRSASRGAARGRTRTAQRATWTR